MKAAAKKNTLNSMQQTSAPSLKKYSILLGLIAFFVFANTLGHDYNMDDTMVTRNHPLTSKGFNGISEIFTSPYYQDAMGYAYGYRPIVHLSFAIEHEIFGEKPGASHFINVILFAVSVILLFKLLVQWLGKDKLLYAGIATLLFAVHPIHSEVVASIKNRDEILAFLFILWSGLQLGKYIEKNKFIHLVGILLLFTIAMLSKKSIYPMVFILPAAFILLKEISLKNILIGSICLIIPGAIIGSDLQISRMLIMALAPIIGLVALYYIKSQILLKTINWREILKQWYTPTLFIAILLIIATFTSYYLLLATIPLFYWLFKTSSDKGIIVSTLSMVFINQFIQQNSVFEIAALVLPNLYIIHLWLTEKKHSIVTTVIAFLGLSYYLYFNHGIQNLLMLLNFVLVAWILFKKPLIAFIAAITVLIGWAVYTKGTDIAFYTVLMTVITAYIFYDKKMIATKFIRYFALSTIVLAFAYSTFNEWSQTQQQVAPTTEQVTTNTSPKFQAPVKSDNILKEGRMLEYAENTLMAPHTTSETIATGFLTLGEYLRLYFYPKDFAFYYGFATIQTVDFSTPLVIVSILFHFLLIGIAIWQLKKRPIIAIGVLWYLLSILLFSNWVELVAGMVGERLAFTASAGLSIFLTGCLFWLKPDFNFKSFNLINGVFIGIVLILGARTITRNKDWKDTLTLMSHDMPYLHNSAQANNLYARTLMGASVNTPGISKEQKTEMQRNALTHFDQATAIWPDFFNAHFDKGMAARHIPDNEKAVEAFSTAIEMNPAYLDSYTNLYEVYEQMGNQSEQLKTAQQLLKQQDYNVPYVLIARAYFLQNEKVKALQTIEEGLVKHPNDELLVQNLAEIKAAQ